MNYAQVLETPIGILTITASEQGVRSILFNKAQIVLTKNKHTQAMTDWLRNYFSGQNLQQDVSLDVIATPFYTAVWQLLQAVPCGETTTYATLAGLAGNAKAVRAVGSAMRRNPLPIYVPCHRVIQSSGNMGNYSGGVHVKKWLLEFEKSL